LAENEIDRAVKGLYYLVPFQQGLVSSSPGIATFQCRVTVYIALRSRKIHEGVNTIFIGALSVVQNIKLLTD
jgi:hypothetical protein